MIAATIEWRCRSVVTPLTNDRSILRMWIGELQDVGQRRVAGAEVVDGQPNAGSARASSVTRTGVAGPWSGRSRMRRSVISKHNRSGARPCSWSTDWTRWTKPSPANWPIERFTDIDRRRSGRRVVEGGEVGAGGPQDEVVELALQSGVFGHPQERRRLEQPTLGMVPTDERLEADHRRPVRSTMGW